VKRMNKEKGERVVPLELGILGLFMGVGATYIVMYGVGIQVGESIKPLLCVGWHNILQVVVKYIVPSITTILSCIIMWQVVNLRVRK